MKKYNSKNARNELRSSINDYVDALVEEYWDDMMVHNNGEPNDVMWSQQMKNGYTGLLRLVEVTFWNQVEKYEE